MTERAPMADETLNSRLLALNAWYRDGRPDTSLPNFADRNGRWTPLDMMPALLARLATAEAKRDAAIAQVARMETALRRLRDCDWVISLPDRMDAVRDIAREGLGEKP